MLTIRALTGGETYASRHLSANDYYAENETVIGQWMGRGAEMLGLSGDVALKSFDAVRQGIDPTTGEFLRPRQSADRFNEEGERTQHRPQPVRLYGLGSQVGLDPGLDRPPFNRSASRRRPGNGCRDGKPGRHSGPPRRSQ